MAASNVREVVLRYSVDVASVRRVEESAKDVQNAVGGISDPLGQLGLSAANSVKRLGSSFEDAQRSIQDAQYETETLRQELLALDDVVVKPTVNVQEAGGALSRTAGAQNSGLETVDRLGSIGSQVFGGVGAGGLGNAAGLVGDIAGAFASANPLLAAGAVAAAGLGVVFGEFTRRADEARQAAQRYTDELIRQASEVTGGKTSDQLQAEIAALESDNAFIQRRTDAITAANTAVDAAYAEATDKANQFAQGLASGQAVEDAEARIRSAEAALNQLFGGIEQTPQAVAGVLENLTATIEGNVADIATARTLLDAPEVLANDQAVAQEAAAEAGRAYLNTLDETTRAQLALDSLLTTGTQAQIGAALEAASIDERIQRARLEAARALGTFAEDQLTAMSMELENTRTNIGDMTDALVGLNAAADQAAAALAVTNTGIQAGQFADGLLNALSDSLANIETDAKPFSGTDKFASAYTASVQDATRALAEAERAQTAYDDAVVQSADRIAEAQAGIDERLASIDENAGQQRIDTAIDEGRDLAKLDRDLARERRDIEKEAGRSTLEAVGNRDVLALREAARRRDEALQDAAQADTDQRQDAAQARDQQAEDEARSLERQRQQIQEDGRKRLDQLRTQSARELQERALALSTANFDLRNAQTTERALRIQSIATTNQIVANGLVQVENAYAAHFGRLAAMPLARSGGSAGTATMTPTQVRQIANGAARNTFAQIMRD